MEQIGQNVLERLNPLADVVFSCMFKDMEGAPAMKELINAVLTSAGDEPIAEILEMHSQYPQLADDAKGKSGRLDVKVKTLDGEVIDTEVQLDTESFFVDRETFYGHEIMLEELERGMSYQDIPKTRVIALMDFSLRKEHPDIVQPIKMMYTRPPIEVATDTFRIYNVELPKFKKHFASLEKVADAEVKDKTLAEWLYMLTKGYKNEEEMKMLETRTAGMDNFVTLYRKANMDQKLRDQYMYRLSAQLDEASKLREAKESGIAIGEELLGKLIHLLLSDNRVDLISIVSTDEKARAQYYKQYNLI